MDKDTAQTKSLANQFADGTLYRQSILRGFMALEMLAQPIHMLSVRKAKRLWNAIYVFRKVREQIRDRGGEDELLSTLEYRVPAQQLNIDEGELEVIVQEWMYRRPLKYLKLAKYSGIDAFMQLLAKSNTSIGVLSDYPAAEKLKAMGLDGYVNLVLSATEPEVNAFKPSPAGFLQACERWGVSPEQVLYVGDRPEVDALGAANAGMSCVIVGKKGGQANQYTSLYTAVPSYTEFAKLLQR
jgi:HAD superfamily hydrolase (TIGR01549 family)